MGKLCCYGNILFWLQQQPEPRRISSRKSIRQNAFALCIIYLLFKSVLNYKKYFYFSIKYLWLEVQSNYLFFGIVCSQINSVIIVKIYSQ